MEDQGIFAFDLMERGKLRHIRSVHIAERVVQRCLCDNALVPLFSAAFVYDNAASLKGKGIDFAMDRLTCHLQRYYRKHGTDGWALVFDFRTTSTPRRTRRSTQRASGASGTSGCESWRAV